MAKILPLKLNVFKCFAEAGDTPLTSRDIYNKLQPIYGGERQFTLKNLQSILDSLLAVDMIVDTGVEFGENDELVIYYKIGNLGKERIKYIEV